MWVIHSTHSRMFQGKKFSLKVFCSLKKLDNTNTPRERMRQWDEVENDKWDLIWLKDLLCDFYCSKHTFAHSFVVLCLLFVVYAMLSTISLSTYAGENRKNRLSFSFLSERMPQWKFNLNIFLPVFSCSHTQLENWVKWKQFISALHVDECMMFDEKLPEDAAAPVWEWAIVLWLNEPKNSIISPRKCVHILWLQSHELLSLRTHPDDKLLLSSSSSRLKSQEPSELFGIKTRDI